jgi:hypothetical protein
MYSPEVTTWMKSNFFELKGGTNNMVHFAMLAIQGAHILPCFFIALSSVYLSVVSSLRMRVLCALWQETMQR